MESKAQPWLLVVDPQNIFADPASEWASPFFESAFTQIERLAAVFAERVLVTRWLPSANRGTEAAPTSWMGYFETWKFADLPAADPLYELIPAAQNLSPHPSIDEPTFGKWGQQLQSMVGEGASLVVTGVSTDCCVISTVLAAADAGCWIKVATDAVAHSSSENGAAALQVMSLFTPQVELKSTAEILAEL